MFEPYLLATYYLSSIDCILLDESIWQCWSPPGVNVIKPFFLLMQIPNKLACVKSEYFL